MVDQIIQASFNSGEWSPKLYARVDLTKYRSAAALLENFFVDYRGGASTRPGTKYILQCNDSTHDVRLIPFQASFSAGYILEFGNFYIRFFSNGSPVLETATTITAAAAGPPEVFTDAGHGYLHGDWIFAGGDYYIINTTGVNTFTLVDLLGNAVNTNPFTLPTSARRVYTIASPYAAADLARLKFAQNVSQLVLCHPSYPTQVLTLIAAANWTILPVTIGTSAGTPVGLALFPSASLLAGGPAFYSYVVTSVDSAGEESSPSARADVGGQADIRTTSGTIEATWTAVAGAVGYNVYRAAISYGGLVPGGSAYGFIGSCTSTAFVDDNIAPDFTVTPPISRNPFAGSGVASVAVTGAGIYTVVPGVSFTGAASTIAGSASAVLGLTLAVVAAGGAGYVVGDSVLFTNSVALVVATIGGGGSVLTWQPITYPGSSAGSVTGVGTGTPANPLIQVSTSGAGAGVTVTATWGVLAVQVVNSGSGYVSTPTVTFTAGAATATVTLSGANGYPSVPGFFQQRLVLAAPLGAPQTFYMSQPGAYYNFNVSQITQPDDSISASLVSGQLNTIRAMVPQTSGLLMFTDRNSWLINGGSPGSAITPGAIVANAQSFNGISDVPPIISNFDVLYVQAKGSIVRDSAYNIYANVYTGTDISALASHLFYGFTVVEWAYAEEPFKVVWAVRDDGTMLTLTFLKEQEFIGWAHSTTTGGAFISVATIIENTATAGEVDAIYTVVQRTINSQTVKYIERVVERTFPTGVADAWCVDCGINYTGAPATSFSGAKFLAGTTVTGLADGAVIPPFVMPTSGTFTLTTPASKVTVGIGYTCNLKTLPLELGDPTVQGKVKKINHVDVRVADTLGLSIGSDENHLTPMKDLIVGNVSSMLVGQTTQIVTDLVNGDARTFLDPTYTVPGQYYIRQANPMPATVLGVIPNITVGDDGGRKG